MNYFLIQCTTVNNVAAQEKQLSVQLQSIASSVSSALGQISGSSALKADMRSALNGVVESISEQQSKMERLSAVLSESVAEYEATEKSAIGNMHLHMPIISTIESIGAVLGKDAYNWETGVFEWIDQYVTWETIGTGSGTQILKEWLDNQNISGFADLFLSAEGFYDLSNLSTGKDQQFLVDKLKELIENSGLEPGIIKGEDIIKNCWSVFDSDKNWNMIAEDFVGTLKSNWTNVVGNPTKILDKLFDVKAPSEIKTAGGIIKLTDAGVGLVSSFIDYYDAQKNGNSELKVESLNAGLENLATFIKDPIEKSTFKDQFINPYSMGIDWIKNGLQNFNTELNKDNATVWDVMYGTFIDSGLETIYETAAGKMKMFGLDIAKVYESRSDVEGYEAVKDGFNDLYNYMEDSGSFTFEGYANGAKIMWDGIVDVGSDIVEGIGGFVSSASGGIGEFFKEWF